MRASPATRRTLQTLVALATALVATAAPSVERPYNVLFIAIDDLQPVLGAYGSQVAETPNMDALLDRGIRFENIQAAKAECAPSRIRAWGFEGTFREKNANLHTMPGWLRNSESKYRTVGVGKILDTRSFSSTDEDDTTTINKPDICEDEDDKFCSWDEYYPPKEMRTSAELCGKTVLRWPTAGENGDESLENDKNYALEYSFDSAYQDRHLDYCVRKLGIEKLQELASNASQPWFLGVGFVQPHMPWVARNEDFGAYRTVPDSLLNPDPLVEDGTTWFSDKEYSARDNQELSKYGNQDDLDDSDRVRGYYAGTRFIDEQIGELMKAFDEIDEEVRQNTLIIMWGDHGFHLGDRGLFGKKTVYEHATRVPAGIVPPENWLSLDSARRNGIGSYSTCPLDTVDFYPTVLDMIGLDRATQSGSTDPVVLGGTSLTGLFEDTDACPRAAALSEYENQKTTSSVRKACTGKTNSNWVCMGYSIRSKCYRLIVYMPLNEGSSDPTPDTSKITAVEIYRYAEPGVWEYEDGDTSDAEMSNAETQLTNLVTSLTDSDWTHLIGQLPFDMDEC
ncbi:Iduronate 2-sulfatase [Hondaea fermentalgiana]|uniref:Iduronate 2-sulfatase n=1 Tax=Hondaea fermentalgiana TaxID=2315210 RepID=A0A2R5GD98_9STRA|nr:Iduronate 2-sulfatase [Hondaea fermentalgiana]|eukprot:GBG26151.1 Iduronate 2-sulfatase [Hondaea fermentalgiana]